jgi:hypothetical protein
MIKADSSISDFPIACVVVVTKAGEEMHVGRRSFMASSTCSSCQLLARVRRLNKTHAWCESQLRLAGWLTAILNHLARQALMHACAVGFIMQRQRSPMAEGAGTVASTLFSFASAAG